MARIQRRLLFWHRGAPWPAPRRPPRGAARRPAFHDPAHDGPGLGGESPRMAVGGRVPEVFVPEARRPEPLPEPHDARVPLRRGSPTRAAVAAQVVGRDQRRGPEGRRRRGGDAHLPPAGLREPHREDVLAVQGAGRPRHLVQKERVLDRGAHGRSRDLPQGAGGRLGEAHVEDAASVHVGLGEVGGHGAQDLDQGPDVFVPVDDADARGRGVVEQEGGEVLLVGRDGRPRPPPTGYHLRAGS